MEPGIYRYVFLYSEREQLLLLVLTVIPVLQSQVNRLGNERVRNVRMLSERIGEMVSGAQDPPPPQGLSAAADPPQRPARPRAKGSGQQRR